MTEEGGGTVFDELPIGNPCRGALAAGGLSFRDLPSHAGADGDGSRVTRIDGRWRRTVVISAVTNDDVPDHAPDDDAVYRAHASELIDGPQRAS